MQKGSLRTRERSTRAHTPQSPKERGGSRQSASRKLVPSPRHIFAAWPANESLNIVDCYYKQGPAQGSIRTGWPNRTAHWPKSKCSSRCPRLHRPHRLLPASHPQPPGRRWHPAIGSPPQRSCLNRCLPHQRHRLSRLRPPDPAQNHQQHSRRRGWIDCRGHRLRPAQIRTATQHRMLQGHAIQNSRCRGGTEFGRLFFAFSPPVIDCPAHKGNHTPK